MKTTEATRQAPPALATVATAELGSKRRHGMSVGIDAVLDDYFPYVRDHIREGVN